ncbi:MAG TPA: hypothetical protein V6C65_08965 [Allocoleopsis sp.]
MAKLVFAPYHPTIGSFWPVCLVQPFTIGGQSHGKTMLYAELVEIDYKSGKVKIQYWHDDRKEIAGGLVTERIDELPAVEGEIDTSHRSFTGLKDVKRLQKSYDDFYVTLDDALAGDFESVTGDVCVVCGNPKSARARTCSPKCRKALSRMK